ncbi:hypothetical protein QIS74_13727 [Colletotrichum tabaci]|uniref:Uncharacterized protein n=1 Tax=Colletotrichum tabaci TaxID=1209068 RepID=A0AAV9SV98_9PEZI
MKASDPPTLNLRAAEDAKKAMDLRVDGMVPVADRGEDEQEQEDAEADKCGSADSRAMGSLLLDDGQNIADSDQDSVEAPRDVGSLLSGGKNSFEISPLRASNSDDDDDDLPAFSSPIQNTDDAKETTRRPGDILASLHLQNVAIRKLRRSSQQQSTVAAEEKSILLASNNSAGEHKGKDTSPALSQQHPPQDCKVAGHPEMDKVSKDKDANKNEDATRDELLNSNDIPAPKADTTTIGHAA